MNVPEGPAALYEFFCLEGLSKTQQARSPHKVNNACTTLSARAGHAPAVLTAEGTTIPLQTPVTTPSATNAVYARSHT